MCTIYSSCDHTTNTIYINTTIEVEKIIEVPVSVEVEKIVYINTTIEVEKIVEVPVSVEVEKIVYINTTIEVEKIIEVPVEVEKIVYKWRDDDPVGNRTKNWGRPGYTHCDQPYSWSELVYGYKDNKVPVKSGGLGKLLERGGYQTWVCIHHHFCGDPFFCWVYHETHEVFTPWGTNGELRLVKS